MPKSKAQMWEWIFLALVLSSLCAAFTCVMPWSADESVIELQLRHFLDTGHLTYIFQHYDARFTFSKMYYKAVLLFQHDPLDPAGYELARVPSGLFIFLSAMAVAFYLRRATQNMLVAGIGALLIVVACVWLQVFSLRYDTPYLLGISSLVFAVAIAQNRDTPHPPAIIALTFITSLAICCFSFLSHPNGIACLLCWGVLALYYQNLMGKYRAPALVGAIALLAMTCVALLDGRSPAQFSQDLMMVKDQYHNFDLAQSFWNELVTIKTQHDATALLLLAAILVSLHFLYRWKTVRQRPLEMMVLLCFLFLASQAAKWPSYNLLLIPPLVCLLGEGLYAFANNTGVRRSTVKRMHIVLCVAALALTSGLYVKAYRYSLYNSLFQYAFHVGDFDYAKYAQLKTELAGRPYSFFSDLRIIPLFSFMDISIFYRDWHGRLSEDAGAPWDEDGAFVLCSAEYGYTCRWMVENNHYPDHAVTYFDAIKLFGEHFTVYAISPRPGPDYRPPSLVTQQPPPPGFLRRTCNVALGWALCGRL